jgi:pantetheine-phosphate adenylyltransferase
MAAEIETRGSSGGELRSALCPGSFDPVTRGHLDVIRRAADLFDRLYVGVVENPRKTPLFSASERVALLRQELQDLAAIEIISFQGITIDLAEELGARWIVRGVRSGRDAEHELLMAGTNRAASPSGVETVLLPSRPEVAFIASRYVRQIAAEGGDVSAMVTPAVEKALRRKLGRP